MDTQWIERRTAERNVGNPMSNTDPQPVKVSFEQTSGGTRMLYLSLTDRRGKVSGKVSKTQTVSENPLVNLDWHADGTLLGIEVIA